MAIKGRRPTPTATKILRGNPGKRAINHDEPIPGEYAEMPEPPDWLDAVGETEWYRVGPYLMQNGLLTEADYMIFATYCVNISLLVESVRQIDEQGMTIRGARGDVRNPALASFSAATTALRNLAGEFGMTPSSRSRIKMPTDDGESLDDLLEAAGSQDDVE